MSSRRAWMVRRSNPVGRAGACLDGRGGAFAIQAGLPLGRAALWRWWPSWMVIGRARLDRPRLDRPRSPPSWIGEGSIYFEP
jgi:hypothetical protein